MWNCLSNFKSDYTKNKEDAEYTTLVLANEEKKLSNKEKALELRAKEIALIDEQIKSSEEKGFVNQAKLLERKKLEALFGYNNSCARS